MLSFSGNDAVDSEYLAGQRARMVDVQLRQRGIRDQRLLTAMAGVPRENFIAPELSKGAYADGPIPIGEGQTVSQPYMVAAMVEALQTQPTDRVLEVGTGTGYEGAILGELVAEVWTIERHPQLAAKAEKILAGMGYSNVHVICGDGSLGLPQHAPFDKIIVAAAAPRVPPSLVAQLAEGGRLVVPVGDRTGQQLQIVQRKNGEIVTSSHTLCCFVPLIGSEGWDR